MGYTVYLRNQLDHHPMQRWQMFVEAVKHVASEIKVPLASGRGDVYTQPQFDNTRILFNGIEDDAHESMFIPRVYEYQEWQDQRKPIFNFCKTARKPYDVMVKATMLLYVHFFPQAEISCDGDTQDDFAYAREKVFEITGLDIDPETKETLVS